MQAGCQFCDAAFQQEVASGRLSSGSLDVYSCVALAGVATEWLRFGHAEGGLADVQMLDRLLQGLRFTQVRVVGDEKEQVRVSSRPLVAHALPSVSPFSCPQAKADAQVRWAVLNTVTLLRRHEAAHDALAAAMQRGASIGECIALLEAQLRSCDDI